MVTMVDIKTTTVIIKTIMAEATLEVVLTHRIEKTTNILNVLLVLRKSEYQEDMAKLKFAVQSAALNLLEEARELSICAPMGRVLHLIIGKFSKGVLCSDTLLLTNLN